MTNFYSPSRVGFYNDELRADYEASPQGWPEDAIEVSPAEVSFIFNALAQRDTVTYVDGQWVITPYVPPVADQIAAAEVLRTTYMQLASNQIDILTDAVDTDIVPNPTAADIALLKLWKVYRQALRAVNTSAVPIVWPEQPPKASGTNKGANA